MTKPTWVPLVETQYHAGKEIADTIVEAIANERGVHAETAIAAAARIAGTVLFRSFGFAAAKVPPGTPVLSDMANEHGPLLVQTLGTSLAQLDLQIDPAAANTPVSDEHQPHLTLIDTQRNLEPRLSQITRAHNLDASGAAHACALGAALLIHRARTALDPAIGFGIAVYGFIEGLKTMPLRLSDAPTQRKPWYKLW